MTRNSGYNSVYKYFWAIYATLNRLAIHDSMRLQAILERKDPNKISYRIYVANVAYIHI